MIHEKTAHGEQDSVLKGIMAVMSSDVATPPLCCVCGGKCAIFIALLKQGLHSFL